MGYNIKQKIEICLKAEANSSMTQADLALWAKDEYGSNKPPSQTTISRILSSKNELIASANSDFKLVRRRKKTNPLLRRVLTEWTAQCKWEGIPITTPIIQLTAHAIWNQLPKTEKDGQGLFNHKWCNNFVKQLNIDLTGKPDIKLNHKSNLTFGSKPEVSLPESYPLNKVWTLEDKVELQQYLKNLIERENYSPKDIFTIDEFQLFYSLPLDQIFDVSAIDKGLKQSDSPAERSLTIMLCCNIDGSEKLDPLIVGKFEKIDISQSTSPAFTNLSSKPMTDQAIRNKISEKYRLFYKSNINKWITSSMFQKYLLTLDHKLQSISPNRKILILLDDSSSHRILNLNFSNIRLCYLKNNTKNKNPYNTSFYKVRFDYLPMNFGIIEEFRILFRLRQYLAMINLQRLNSKTSTIYDKGKNKYDLSKLKTNTDAAMGVLSEVDYKIPLINVLEWIRLAWDSVAPIKIFDSWKGTRLINFNQPWPSSNPDISNQANAIIQPLYAKTLTYDSDYNYKKLEEVIGYLNVVIPWEIDELIGVVNERCKVTLSYVSIEEIIDSCLLESFDIDELNESGRFPNNFEPEWNVIGEHHDTVSLPEPNNFDKQYIYNIQQLELESQSVNDYDNNIATRQADQSDEISNLAFDSMEWIPDKRKLNESFKESTYNNTNWVPEKRRHIETMGANQNSLEFSAPGSSYHLSSINTEPITQYENGVNSIISRGQPITNTFEDICNAITVLVSANKEKMLMFSKETINELETKLYQLQDH